MKKYSVCFDFTTVHRGGRFVGRSGECEIQTNKNIEHISLQDEGLISCCVQCINQLRPTFKIFSLTITKISPAMNPKASVATDDEKRTESLDNKK